MSTAEAKYRQLKVPELKELLTKKGLQVSGKKEDLIARLLAAEDKKPVETINQPSKNSSNTNTNRKSSIENIINKDPAEPATLNTEVKEDDLFDKDLNLMSATDITTGIDHDFDWDITLQKDGEFDPLISPISPSLSVTSIKDEKARTETTETTKGPNDVTNVEAKQSVETTTRNPEETLKTSSSSNSDSIVKPSGFTCKKIVFDNIEATTTSQVSSKSQTDLTTELERRKKRAERFGVELSDADKKLQRAARFGTTASNPLDAPLTAPRMQNRKPSIVEDEEKLKKRAERFGLDKANNNTSNEEEKKRKRAERFSLNAPSNSSSIPHPSSKSSSNSVSDINEEEKKKRRTERFANDANTNGEPASKKVKT